MFACAPSPARRRKIRQSAQVPGLAGPIMVNERSSHDMEVDMFQRVKTAYQRIARVLKQAAAPRRSVRLNVVQLEERATPAMSFTLLAPIDPPSSMVVVVAPPAAPVHQVLASDTSVRADLFGVGDAGEEQVNELE